MKQTKRRFNIIMSLLLVLALAAPVIAPPTTAEAANKKHTVGGFTLKVPKSWSRTDQTAGVNIQAIFTSTKSTFLAQSTNVGFNYSASEIKPILQQVIENQYKDNFKNIKYSTKSTGIGTAAVATGKMTSGGVTANCRMYAVCKGGYMFMGISMGTTKKQDTKILKSVKLK